MDLLNVKWNEVSTSKGVLSKRCESQKGYPPTTRKGSRLQAAAEKPRRANSGRLLSSQAETSTSLKIGNFISKSSKEPFSQSFNQSQKARRTVSQDDLPSGWTSSPDPLSYDPLDDAPFNADGIVQNKRFSRRPIQSHLRALRSAKHAGRVNQDDEVKANGSDLEHSAPPIGPDSPVPGGPTTSIRRHVTRAQRGEKLLEDQLAGLQLNNELLKDVAKDAERQRKERIEAEKLRRAEEAERERRAGRSAPSRPVIPPLSTEWEEQLAESMEQQYSRRLATAPDGTEITRRDFGTLYPQPGTYDDPSGWLNDEIINTYMRHIVEFAQSRIGHKRNDTPRFHNFVSQFYQNLSKKGPESVARWAKRAKIQGEKLNDVEMVFIPCNPGVHWTMLVVHPKRRLVEYFDSFHGSATGFLGLAEAWLRMELPAFEKDEWKFRAGIGPRQLNSSDCGVFAITTAKMVMLGIDPEKAYTENDLPQQRKRIACELMNGGFTGDFAPTEQDIFNEALLGESQSRVKGGDARL